jgi:hypothetical protein
MRSKTRRRAVPPVSRSTRPNHALIAIVLVVIGASAALGFERLTSAGGPGAGATPSPSSDVAASSPSDDPALASASGLDTPSDSAAPPASPVAPILDAEMPRSVNGTTLTIETNLGSTILGKDPSSRSFGAAVSTLGVTSDKLEIAFGYDATGALTLSVLGFRIPGIAPTKLRPLVLESWLLASAPGVTSAAVTVGGTAATKVSYGDQGADEYVFVHGDSVFIVESDNQALATAVVQAMPVGPAPSAGPSGSVGVSSPGSPTASPSGT